MKKTRKNPFRILLILTILLIIFTSFILGVNKRQRRQIKMYKELIHLYELKEYQNNHEKEIYFNPDTKIVEV